MLPTLLGPVYQFQHREAKLASTPTLNHLCPSRETRTLTRYALVSKTSPATNFGMEVFIISTADGGRTRISQLEGLVS